MKILVFGKTGQVAKELALQADVTSLDRQQADFSNPAECADWVKNSDADVVINAAAYTAVDLAETQKELAMLVNGHTPIAIAKAAATKNIPFLHISTDYVFDGSGNDAWLPTDKANPKSVYGFSKLFGEQGIEKVGGDYAILRTSWVFSAHGNNFVKTMLRLGNERSALSVVNDQIGGPTCAADIASALLEMAAGFQNNSSANGIYHFCGAPAVTWKDFAIEIFEQSGLKVDVKGIPSAEYPTPAARPLNSRLDCSTLLQKFGISQPDWRLALRKVLTTLETST